MMRYCRRACRQWRNEFLAFWGRFNTFCRMVFGIILAMAMVFTARRQVLDGHGAAVAALNKELSGKSVPVYVPGPASDNEVQEAELQAENLQTALERERRETRAILEKYPDGSQNQARETIELLTRLISQHGLMVHTASRCDAKDNFPLARLCQSYALAGDFAGVYGFLNDVANLKAPCRLRQLSLSLQNTHKLPDALSPASPSAIVLSFIFESFYFE